MSAITLIATRGPGRSGSDRRAQARLLVLVRLARELDDRLLALERVLAVDADPFLPHLDDVVAGSPVPAEAKRRDGAGGDHEQVLEVPGIWDVLVPGEHELHAGTQ